jgi:transcriptional regulator with XRE-family HTH domain
MKNPIPCTVQASAPIEGEISPRLMEMLKLDGTWDRLPPKQRAQIERGVNAVRARYREGIASVLGVEVSTLAGSAPDESEVEVEEDEDAKLARKRELYIARAKRKARQLGGKVGEGYLRCMLRSLDAA